MEEVSSSCVHRPVSSNPQDSAGAVQQQAYPAAAPRKKTNPLIPIVVVLLAVGGTTAAEIVGVDSMQKSCSGRSATMPDALAELPILREGGDVCRQSVNEGMHMTEVEIEYRSGFFETGKDWQSMMGVWYAAKLGEAGWDGVQCGFSGGENVERLCFRKGTDELSVNLHLLKGRLFKDKLATKVQLVDVGERSREDATRNKRRR